MKKFITVDTDVLTTTEAPEILPKLKPGMYQVSEHPQTEALYFKRVVNNHDGIIDIKDSAYNTVVKEIETFLNPDTHKKFVALDFIYKRSTLLYGRPGTGKTVLVNRLANLVKERGGITLFNTQPYLLQRVFSVLEEIQPETFIMVIFEEFDSLCENQESVLLNLLDGEIQKRNVLYVATTNYVNKIPNRIKRPGRFSSLVEVGLPSKEARRQYLEHRLQSINPKPELEKWIDLTDGFSIDELAETVKSHICLNVPLNNIIARVREFRKVASDEDYESANGVDYEEDFKPSRRLKKKW